MCARLVLLLLAVLCISGVSARRGLFRQAKQGSAEQPWLDDLSQTLEGGPEATPSTSRGLLGMESKQLRETLAMLSKLGVNVPSYGFYWGGYYGDEDSGTFTLVEEEQLRRRLLAEDGMLSSFMDDSMGEPGAYGYYGVYPGNQADIAMRRRLLQITNYDDSGAASALDGMPGDLPMGSYYGYYNGAFQQFSSIADQVDTEVEMRRRLMGDDGLQQ